MRSGVRSAGGAAGGAVGGAVGGAMGGAMAAAMGAVVLALGAVACSDGDDVAGPATTADDTLVSTAVTTRPTVEETVPATTETPATTSETIATVPDDGVPGIDSDDPFCRAWSEFAGSFQALTLASSFGDPAEAARLEVASSGAVSTAVDVLAEEFPADVEAERTVFLDELIGPFGRRAERAVTELDAAGATTAQIDALGDAWLDTLADTGVDDPEVVLVVADDLAVPLDAAVVVFAANLPPIPADPSLITDAQAPATLAYLAANCPDQGILAGNDVIDG